MSVFADHIDALFGATAIIGAALIAGMVKLILDQRAASRAALADRDAHSQRLAAVESQMRAVVTATTVNHHASQPPTLPDRLDTVQSTLTGLAATVEAHHHEQQRRNDQQDDRLARGMARFGRIESAIKRNHPQEDL